MTRATRGALLALAALCWVTTTARPQVPGPARTLPSRALTVGVPAQIDLGASAPRPPGTPIRVRFTPDPNGLRLVDGEIRGTPLRPAVMAVTVVIGRQGDRPTTLHFPIVVFADGLPVPVLPTSPSGYSDLRVPMPRHFLADASGSARRDDNTPADNPVTDAGATLGRVLFHDPRLSGNDRIACASCHQQQFGFADTARFSRGIDGALTPRRTMALANARFYQSGRFFRDERAATLEAQVLEPIASPGEMGLPLDAMLHKLRATSYYPPLFAAAFGTPDITVDRVSRALAQFVRSITSYRSRLDSLYRGGGPPDLQWLTPLERQGRALFLGRAACTRCHRTNALHADLPANIGLDATVGDSGAGGGKFKAPSLRNVAIRPPYMHDGRFRTLTDVVAFYDSGIVDTPHLDPRLRQADGAPQRLRLTPEERAAIVAYLATFTDEAMLRDERFASPFQPR